MSQAEKMEAAYQEQMVRSIVEETLRQLGLSDGLKNYSQCRQIWGKWFTEHAKKGDFTAIKHGSRKMYSVASINALRAAEMRLAARHSAALRPEPDII